MRVKASKPHPNHWSILTESDQAQYRQLQLLMEPLSFRTSREESPVKFQIILDHIKQFAVRHNSDDWKRCLVCGIIWLDSAVAISPKQLSMLIGKCKSAINAGFQALGYVGTAMSPAYAVALFHIFCNLDRKGNEIRQWSVRESSAPFCPSPARLPPKAPLRRTTDAAEAPKPEPDDEEDGLTSSVDLDWLATQDDSDEAAERTIGVP
jgi:hypothetical protein